MPSVPPFFEPYQRPIHAALNAFVPEPAEGGAGTAVVNAMRATLLAPAKRVRAVLVLLSADLCGGTATFAMPAACAVEAIHASSLVLDDLPCMDDADLRRGQPAAHIQFGEAVAILAAFGLLNEAFGHVARSYDAGLAQRISATLSNAVGLDGLIAGQSEDVLASETTITFATLERIHRRKTGVLFSAAASAGALTAGATVDDISALTAYAKNLGLAFQIVDDLLDVIGTTAETGKAVRADARKTTFVSFSGVEGARALAGELCETAKQALTPFGRRAESLHALADFVAARRG
ncbi:MAG TPA: polyprenyl synthetase family protein [Vicinamibacterales bacterium]|nr:polyprenyl synthetase family protein [Vicinamibacterales bacterium]